MTALNNNLAEYLRTVPKAIRQMPVHELLHKPAPGKWSKQEIFGHLCDSALHNLSRFAHAATARYSFSNYQQDKLVGSNNYQQQQLSEIILLWQSLNQQIQWVWENTPEDNWQVPVINAELKIQEPLVYWAEDYLKHMEHHLKQIFGDLSILREAEFTDQVSLREGEKALASQSEQRFVKLMENGSMSVELYHPNGRDLQEPHRQDELYVVVAGEGTFYRAGERTKCQTGDILFVPAGIIHRFEEFTEDFKVWVIFYGIDGGEVAQSIFEDRMTIGEDSYLVSTSNEKLDHRVIFSFLQNSYWAKGRPTELLQRSLDQSLNFGLYINGEKQIGFARIITDYATMAYLADVFVLKEYRGKGLGKYLMDCVMSHSALEKIPKILLHTRDAHDLYLSFGFERNPRAETLMERRL